MIKIKNRILRTKKRIGRIIIGTIKRNRKIVTKGVIMLRTVMRV